MIEIRKEIIRLCVLFFFKLMFTQYIAKEPLRVESYWTRSVFMSIMRENNSLDLKKAKIVAFMEAYMQESFPQCSC